MSRRTVVALVAVLTTLLHLGGVVAANADFVYDDHRFIEANPAAKTLQPPWRYLDPASAGPGWEGIYRPLRTLSFALDHAAFGDRVRWWRLESVLLHGLTAGLLAALLLELTGHAGAAALGALVFGLHPATAEVSSWLSSRGDLLALLGALTAALLHVRGRTLAAAGVFLLALLAKESVLVLPALLLLVDEARGARPLRSAASVGSYATLVAVAAVAFVLRAAELGVGNAFGQTAPAGWPERRAAGLLRDLAATVLPVNLGFDLQVAGSPALTVALVALMVALVLVAVLLGLRGRRLEAAGIGWYLVGLVPVSLPFLPLKIATADRFLYVPLAGVGLVAAALAARLRWSVPRVAAAGALLVLLGALTADRAAVYASDGRLWAAASAADPENVRALQGVAFDRYRQACVAAARGLPDEARGLFEKARDLFEAYVASVPEDAKAQYMLGQICQSLARGETGAVRAELVRRALARYREAIQLWESGAALGRDPYLREACLGSARLALAAGDAARAEADAASAVAAGAGGEAFDLLRDAALVGLERGDLDGAARAARTLLRLDPGRSAGDLVRELRGRLLALGVTGQEARLCDLEERLR